MARIGMDVGVVTQHGTALKNIGDGDLPALLGRVDHLVGEIQGSWSGHDSEQFQSNWNNKDRPALEAIAQEMCNFGQQAITNAQQQAQTSASAGSV